MAITTNALARALSLSCSEGISSHDIIFLQALSHISNWNLFIRHTFHPSLRANVQFVHYFLIVTGLLLPRWENNNCTRSSGSLAYLQPIQPSSHNDFHDCIKQWHGRIPTTPVKMQTGKRLRSLIAMVDWHRRWNSTWTLTNQQGTEAVRKFAGLDDTYLSSETILWSTFRDLDTSLIAKWYGFC